MPDFNIQDPAKQEAVRRKSHEYVPGDGRHGTYVERPYHHQEYPKVMDARTPPPRKAFKTDEEFKAALADFDDEQKRSIVNNKAEEDRWLAANGKKKQQPATSEQPAAPAKKRKSKKAA